MNNQHDGLILKYAKEFKVLPEFIKGIIDKESSFKPSARGDDSKNVRGTRRFKPPDGRYCSYGLGQANWCSGTAQSFWKVSSYKDLFNPEVAIAGIARYLRYQLDRYGNDYKKAVSAYNAGSHTNRNSDYVAIVFAKAAKYATDFSRSGNYKENNRSNVNAESGHIESGQLVMIVLGVAILIILVTVFKQD